MNHIARLARPCSVVAIALVCLSAKPAGAVVVSAFYQDATAVAPGGNPGWFNVGKRGTASASYLGNRWVITANHVGDGSVKFSDGRVFGLVAGSGVRLTNDAGQAIGSPDLRMFRLVDDPGLPSLEIDTASPSAGDSVMMIGAGRDRADALVGWSATGFSWEPVPLPLANRLGYMLESTSTMRWGTNTVTGPFSINGATAGFSTLFNRPGDYFEAQAVIGDSGGGVFRLVDDTWKLVGLMATAQPLPGQPAGTVVFGNSSQSADLTAYREQIMDLVTAADPLWQNQANYYDVDRSGMASSRDLLLIINELIRSGSHELEGAPSAGGSWLDVSGDGFVSARDSLLVTNALLGETANPTTASASGAMFVPEPSTAALVLLGLLTVALARCLTIIRRRCA